MRMTWLVLAFVLLARAADADTCVEIASGEARQAAARATAEKRYAKVLADKKLRSVALHTVQLSAPTIDVSRIDTFRPDEVRSAKEAAKTVQVVTAISSSCGGSHEEFVEKGKTVFRVMRRPKPGTTTTVTVCGCPSPHYVCGGAALTSSAIGYVLPDGTTFGGVVMIEYVADTVALGSDRPCTPPPPPP